MELTIYIVSVSVFVINITVMVRNVAPPLMFEEGVKSTEFRFPLDTVRQKGVY